MRGAGENPRRHMPDERSPATLLRFAALLIDLLLVALVLILPATIISWGLVAAGNSTRIINVIWWGAVVTLTLAMLLRDGWHGRSPGKRLFGLQIRTASGRPCSWTRSLIRNLPLAIPLWNLVELWMVAVPRHVRRTGDILAKTQVVEE